MGIVDGLAWRYQLRLKPFLLLDQNPWRFLRRQVRNKRLARGAGPMVYLYADATNVGDLASGLGVQALAGVPGIELFCAPAALHETARTLRDLEQHNAMPRLIVGGGGLLQECFTQFWQLLLQYPFPFAVFGVGANELPPARRLPPAHVLEKVANQARFIHVRDRRTQELLQRLAGRPVSLGPCPSVNYLQRFARHENQGSAMNPVLLHVIHPVDLQLSGVEPDAVRQTVRDVAGRLGLPYDETTHIADLTRTVRRYLRAGVVVTSRLHGAIFSYALGVPFVVVACDEKIRHFVETFAPGIDVLPPTVDACQLRQAVNRAHASGRSIQREVLPRQLQVNQHAMRLALAELALPHSS